MEEYQILDNGGNPFTVKVEEGKVSIFVNHYNENYDEDSINLEFIKEYTPSRIFIGKSPLSKMTEFSGARNDSSWNGNSILLEINLENLEYVYIGYEIYSFKAYAKIISYDSPVGNSGVSYPYALDELDNYYLMIENVVIEDRNDRITGLLFKGEDPYRYYYDNVVNTFEDFKSLKIDGSMYIFGYELEDFDEFKARFNNSDIIGIKKDGTEVIFNRESYEGLMKRFGDFKGFKPIKNKVIIQERI
jgi:hypothetical protein